MQPLDLAPFAFSSPALSATADAIASLTDGAPPCTASTAYASPSFLQSNLSEISGNITRAAIISPQPAVDRGGQSHSHRQHRESPAHPPALSTSMLVATLQW